MNVCCQQCVSVCVPQPAPRVPLCSASSALQCLFLSRHRCCSQSFFFFPFPFFFFFRILQLSFMYAAISVLPAVLLLLLPASCYCPPCSLSCGSLHCGPKPPNAPSIAIAGPNNTPCYLSFFLQTPYSLHCGPHAASVAGPMPPPLQTPCGLAALPSRKNQNLSPSLIRTFTLTFLSVRKCATRSMT
jgi:hypothetical protein